MRGILEYLNALKDFCSDVIVSKNGEVVDATTYLPSQFDRFAGLMNLAIRR